jgi:hypothetical protein
MTEISVGPAQPSQPSVAETTANGGSREAAPSSILTSLRQAAKKQVEEKFEDFAVGGDFGDKLQIRYKPLGPDMMDDFLASKTEVTMQRAIEMNMDMMSRSCIAVIGYDQLTGVKTILKDEHDRNIGLDARLVKLLEIPHDESVPLTARDVISFLFGNNGPAIGAHGDKVSTWMQDPSQSKSSSL